MLVKELIEKLKELPQDLRVCYDDHEDWPREIDTAEKTLIYTTTIRWIEVIDEEDKKNKTKAIVILR